MTDLNKLRERCDALIREEPSEPGHGLLRVVEGGPKTVGVTPQTVLKLLDVADAAGPTPDKHPTPGWSTWHYKRGSLSSPSQGPHSGRSDCQLCRLDAALAALNDEETS